MLGGKTWGRGTTPVLVSALLGLAVGACGGAGDGSDGGLEPSLGQGNAASIRTEYLALGLPLASQDTGSIGCVGVAARCSRSRYDRVSGPRGG